ncbi:MAG: hypothetical protein M1821_005174 [Bathelium mastoideum]|nr:MAG: hypothetical protein M1821_005174 [Bathelium mastoideum]
MEAALKQNITVITVSVGTCTSPRLGIGADTAATSTVFTTNTVTACAEGSTCSSQPETVTGSPSGPASATGSAPPPALGTANTGTGDSGIGDTGNNDSGDYDSGDNDSGNYDSGNWDSGNYDTGDHESTNGDGTGRKQKQMPDGFIARKDEGA